MSKKFAVPIIFNIDSGKLNMFSPITTLYPHSIRSVILVDVFYSNRPFSRTSERVSVRGFHNKGVLDCFDSADRD